MVADQLAFDFDAIIVLPVWTPPHEGYCGCGAETLVVWVAGVEVILDRAEVLEPYPCPLCAQVEAKGHTRGACWRCGGSKVLGESFPVRGVLVDEDGRARSFRGGAERPAAGDAVHRLHACVVAVAA